MHTYSICFQLFPFNHRLFADIVTYCKLIQGHFACRATSMNEQAKQLATTKRQFEQQTQRINKIDAIIQQLYEDVCCKG